MAKIKRRTSSSSIAMKCKGCNNDVKNVDSDSFSILCFRCTARELNPNTIFVDELTREKWNEIRRKL